jgi:hypothetical protein
MQPVVNAFHTAVSAKRDAIFDDDRLTPISAIQDAVTPAPGWVGKNWKSGGTLLMAINPGGGGDNYRVNPTDARLYGLIRDFRAARSAEERGAGLRKLSDAWIQIQASHNIRRIIDAVFKALGTDAHQTAFLNVLPFRTREDRPARVWDTVTKHQVAALAPRRIVALGCKAYDALLAAEADEEYEIVLLKRAIGDSRITPHAQGVLDQLRDENS